MNLKKLVNGNIYNFNSLTEVLAKANEPKSADRLQKIAAETVSERVAAKIVIADLTIKDIVENPLLDYNRDEVTRVNIDGMNKVLYNRIKNWTIGEYREWILSHTTTAEDLDRYSRAITGEVAAAVTKLMTAMDLIYGAKKINVTTKCVTEIGQRGTLSFRLQPNSTTDNIDEIMASIMEGLSYGSGDACLGVNPVNDSVENTIRIANAMNDFVMKHDIPTQLTVLSHISTQMSAMEKGAPLSMLFQSIAGTDSAHNNFGINKSILDDAYKLALEYSNGIGPNLLYFETGQGSEVSIGADEGIDEMTLEARTYGFARYFRPFMVNNVSGFIGPETLYDGKEMIRANLEDHFMGKLLGLPMGMAPCYTNHTSISLDDQEMATIMLALAGANYFMGIPVGDDVMLSYQDTSYHDDATLRELTDRKPAPEFFNWLKSYNILDENGILTSIAGDGSIFI